MQHLVNLIASMDRGEKSHFSSLYKNDKARNFFKLYKFIQQNPTTTHEDLRKRFSTIPQIHYELNNLYNRILQCLVNRKLSTDTPDYKIRNLILRAEILLEKRNFKEGQKLVKRARKLAETYEKHEHLLSILRIENKIVVIQEGIDIRKERMKIFNRRKQVLATLDQIYHLDVTIADLINLQYEKKIPIGEKEVPAAIKENTILNREIEALSTQGGIFINFAKGTKHTICGAYREAYQHLMQAMKIMIEKKHIRNPTIELITLNNLLETCIIGDMIPEFEEWHTYLRNFKATSEAQKVKLMYHDLSFRVLLMLRHLKLDRYDKLYEEATAFILSRKKFISRENLNNLRHDLIYGALLKCEYENAHEQLLNWQITNKPLETAIEKKRLSICIHIGLENHFLVSSEVQAYKRLIQKVDEDNPVTRIFLKLVRSLSSNVDYKRRKILVQVAHKNFQKLASDKQYQRYFTYFNYVYWLERCHSKLLSS